MIALILIIALATIFAGYVLVVRRVLKLAYDSIYSLMAAVDALDARIRALEERVK